VINTIQKTKIKLLSVTVGMLAWHRFSVDQISTSFFLALTHKMWFSSHRWTM